MFDAEGLSNHIEVKLVSHLHTKESKLGEEGLGACQNYDLFMQPRWMHSGAISISGASVRMQVSSTVEMLS